MHGADGAVGKAAGATATSHPAHRRDAAKSGSAEESGQPELGQSGADVLVEAGTVSSRRRHRLRHGRDPTGSQARPGATAPHRLHEPPRNCCSRRTVRSLAPKQVLESALGRAPVAGPWVAVLPIAVLRIVRLPVAGLPVAVAGLLVAGARMPAPRVRDRPHERGTRQQKSRHSAVRGRCRDKHERGRPRRRAPRSPDRRATSRRRGSGRSASKETVGGHRQQISRSRAGLRTGRTHSASRSTTERSPSRRQV